MSVSDLNKELVAAIGPFPTKAVNGAVTVNSTLLLNNLLATSTGGCKDAAFNQAITNDIPLLLP